MRGWQFWLGLALVLWLAQSWYLAELKPGPLSLQLSFTPQRFAAVLHFWSEAQLERYRQTLLVDPGLLLCALLAARAYLRACMTHAPDALRVWFGRVFWTAASMQLGTTLAHGWLTAMPRFGLSWLYALVAALALFKWLLLAAGLMLLLWQHWQQEGQGSD